MIRSQNCTEEEFLTVQQSGGKMCQKRQSSQNLLLFYLSISEIVRAKQRVYGAVQQQQQQHACPIFHRNLHWRRKVIILGILSIMPTFIEVLYYQQQIAASCTARKCQKLENVFLISALESEIINKYFFSILSLSRELVEKRVFWVRIDGGKESPASVFVKGGIIFGWEHYTLGLPHEWHGIIAGSHIKEDPFQPFHT